MLKNQMWYCYHDALKTELQQCKDEGKDVSAVEARMLAQNIYEPYTEEDYNKIMGLIDELEALPEPSNPIYIEPSDLESIHREASPRREAVSFDKAAIREKIHGAWIGRITGCLIGKPVEGRQRDYIEKIAKAGNNYPIRTYIKGIVPNPNHDPFFDDDNFKNKCFAEKINGCSPSDDDTNYTTLALGILEKYGRNFTSEDVVEAWLTNFPAIVLCTAEQAAFRNFLCHILPPKSGSYRNPYREWIGGQIRADFFGYINPGDPFTAADYAFRDACCTHTKNGIYGAMFMAAAIAEAAVSDDIVHILQTGLSCIPQKSRLKRDVDTVIAMYQDGKTFEDAVNKAYELYNDWQVHTNPNAMIVAAALLWGEKDFAKTLGLAVMAGMDTDCNGATVGSMIGMIKGAEAIPADFTDPICDTLCTDIVGNARVSVTGMADRTLKFIL